MPGQPGAARKRHASKRGEPGSITSYSLRDVRRLLGLPASTLAHLIDSGLVRPARGVRGALQFSFKDLVTLRAAKALLSQQVSARKLNSALRQLRRCLPTELPPGGLHVHAWGDRIAVGDGRRRWDPATGQLLLDLEVRVARGDVRFIERRAAPPVDADALFAEACALEDVDEKLAVLAYRELLRVAPAYQAAYLNLGCLLHATGAIAAAREAYRAGIARAGLHAGLLFNLGVLEHDANRPAAAQRAYEQALELDETLTDAHYNLALLHERAGRARQAVRHWNAYRRQSRRNGAET